MAWGHIALKANQAFGKLRSTLNTEAVLRAREVAVSVGKSMANGGFALQAGTYGAIGAGVGYLYGDGDRGTMLKGAGLGVLGAAGARAYRNPALRAAATDARAWARGGVRGIMDRAAVSGPAGGFVAAGKVQRGVVGNLADYNPWG